MGVASLRQTELPGTRPIYTDLLYNFRGVGGFYAHPPTLEAAQSAAGEVRLARAHRRALVEELHRQNRDGGSQTQAHLARLADPRTVVVATGQQVGLLGGPVFTLYKALTAVRCAAELTRRGTSAVPVFWLATEDHDLAEVNQAWAFGEGGSPRRLEVPTQGPSGAAVGEIRVPDFRLDEFERLCSGLPFAQEAVALARESCTGAAGFGDSFRALYRKLLEPYGIVFLCPLQPRIRALAAPLLRRAIEQAPQLTDALLQRGSAMQAAGYHQQVHVQASTALVLLFEQSVRLGLKRKNGRYWTCGRSYTSQDLLARVGSTPQDVSPSALLRPVMQDYLLPTAALIAGPSEAAYLGQASVLYDALLGRMPAVLPRASFTVLDDASRKLLRRYGLTPLACMVQRSDLESRVAATLVPPPLQASLGTSREAIEEALRGIASALEGFDPTLAASFDVAGRKITYQLDKIQSKVAREALRRTESAQRHARHLADFVFPNHHPQERVFGTLPMLAKLGPSLVDRVARAIRPGCGDHAILEL